MTVRTQSILCVLLLILSLILVLPGCSDSGDDEDSSLSDGDVTSDDDDDNDGDLDGDLDGDDVVDEDGDTDEEAWPEPELKDQRLELDILGTEATSTTYNKVPFPWNYFTREDESSLTGLRLNLKTRQRVSQEIVNTNVIDRGADLIGEIYLNHANRLNGFSTFGAIMIETTEALDPASLPATSEDSVSDGSLIWLLNLNPDSANYLQRHPFTASARQACRQDDEGTVTEHYFYYLHLQPLRPLEEQSTYLVVARKGMATTEGESLGISEDFAKLCGLSPLDENTRDFEELSQQKARMAPLFDMLRSEFDLNPWDLLLAFDFTTQAISHDLTVIADKLFSGDLGQPQVDLDSSEPADGVADIYTYESFPDRFTGISSSLNDPSVGGIARGVFTSTDYRLPGEPGEEYGGEDFGYSNIHDENDDPIAVADAEVPFILIYPTTDFPQPYPVVIMQHGINSKKEDMTKLAPFFTSLGIAVMTADFVYHGDRDEGSFAPMAFININQPLAAQASFKQAAIDQLHQTYILQHWDLDAFPQGGDGTPDLDGSKVMYLGHSLGSIVGALSAGVNPVPLAWTLNVGGGGLQGFIVEFLAQYGLDGIYPSFYMDQFSTLAQTILDQGDGVNYAYRYANTLDEEGTPRNVLLQECIPDDTVPNLVTENLARAARLPHFPPMDHQVEGLETSQYPGSQFGFAQFAPGWHNLLMSTRYEETISERNRMIAQIIHFFQTTLSDGVGEIIEGNEDDAEGR